MLNLRNGAHALPPRSYVKEHKKLRLVQACTTINEELQKYGESAKCACGLSTLSPHETCVVCGL